MHDHATGFIDDNQVVVLVNHIKRDILAADMAFFGDIDRDGDLCAFFNPKPRIGHNGAVYLHSPVGDQFRQARA